MRHITSPTPCPQKHTTRPCCHQLRQSLHLEVLSIHLPFCVASNSCNNISRLPLLDSTTHLHASGGHQFSNCCPPVPLKVNIPTLLFQKHIIVQLSHPPLIPDSPCQLLFLVYKDGRFHLNHTPHPIRPPPRITSGCSCFIWGLRV